MHKAAAATAGSSVYSTDEQPLIQAEPSEELKTKWGLDLASVRISSPNKLLHQANQLRVNLVTSSRQKDSCMSPVPALDALRVSRAVRISWSSLDVMA